MCRLAKTTKLYLKAFFQQLVIVMLRTAELKIKFQIYAIIFLNLYSYVFVYHFAYYDFKAGAFISCNFVFRV